MHVKIGNHLKSKVTEGFTFDVTTEVIGGKVNVTLHLDTADEELEK